MARTLTFVVGAVLIIPFITIFQKAGQTHSPMLYLGPAGVIVILGITMTFRPTGYSLDPDGLQIHRPLNTVTIPIRSIKSVEPVQISDLGFGLRTFGSGGFFGYFGKFWYRKTGHITFYATDRSKLLLLTLEDRKIVISPEDTAAFLAAFRDLVK